MPTKTVTRIYTEPKTAHILLHCVSCRLTYKAEVKVDAYNGFPMIPTADAIARRCPDTNQLNTPHLHQIRGAI